MQVLAFIQETSSPGPILAGSHSMAMVALSLAIAVLAAHASLDHSRLMRMASTPMWRYLWHASGALAMGLGVWAMHFTGMMALELPVRVNYHVGLTLWSILPAVAAAAITLQVVASRRQRWPAILLGGTLMGLGIGAMHYIGMAAMVMPARRFYQPGLFVSSIVLAVLLAVVSLAIRPWLLARMQRRTLAALLSSAVMGGAVASMHYVAMQATVYLPATGTVGAPGAVMGKETLGLLAVAVAVAILLIATVAVGMTARLLSAEQAIQVSAQRAQMISDRLQQIAERVPGLVYQFRLGPDGGFSFPYASEAIRDIFDLSPDEARRDALPALAQVHADERDAVLDSIHASARTLQVWSIEFRLMRPDGGVRWVHGNATPQRDGAAVVWSGFITDITERKRAEATIERLAYHDPLTQVFNRSKVRQLLEEACRQHGLVPHGHALLVIDFDRFRQLNDTLGHGAGDRLLAQAGQRLLHPPVPGCHVGRLSGDEFVVLCTRLPQETAMAAPLALQLATDVLARLSPPYDLGGHLHGCTLSVGVSVLDDETVAAEVPAEEWLKRAEVAVAHAKRGRGDGVCLFDPQMDAGMRRRFALERALRDALTAEPSQLSLHYQPQVGADNAVIGVEALLRWHHPEHGQVSPAEFIPLAEETGHIEALGDWVLQQACRQLHRWQAPGADPALRGLRISVNVSARQFYQPDFVDKLRVLLDTHPIDHRLLMLELTESLVLADLDDAVARMRQIKAMGLRFSMDDFGTGYSSLSYLSKLPFDEVKIDQSFVKQGADGQRRREWVIVEAIIGIAQKFGIELLAEGVEEEAQRALLAQSGCHNCQGYLFARPAPVDRFETWLRSRPLIAGPGP
ncbi:EAL domain-containing protein [Hydrogenophaga sp. OTU3427]|uniref:EAL domain-containing protein n=1 Tax=Hydrogenophaga sp. OTU3427 TaxID=3043856 RepID=UPI00313AF570